MRLIRQLGERALALLVASAVVFAAVIVNAVTSHYIWVQAIPIMVLLGIVAFALTVRYETIWMSAAWALVPAGFVVPSVISWLRADTLGTRTAAAVMLSAGIEALVMIALGTAAGVMWTRRSPVAPETQTLAPR